MKKNNRSFGNLIAHQGDVGFVLIESLPKEAVPRKDRSRAGRTLMYGEVTGHSHVIAEEDADLAEIYDLGEERYLKVTGAGVSIVHEEHGPVKLAPGTYKVPIEREWNAGDYKRVVD